MSQFIKPVGLVLFASSILITLAFQNCAGEQVDPDAYLNSLGTDTGIVSSELGQNSETVNDADRLTREELVAILRGRTLQSPVWYFPNWLRLANAYLFIERVQRAGQPTGSYVTINEEGAAQEKTLHITEPNFNTFWSAQPRRFIFDPQSQNYDLLFMKEDGTEILALMVTPDEIVWRWKRTLARPITQMDFINARMAITEFGPALQLGRLRVNNLLQNSTPLPPGPQCPVNQHEESGVCVANVRTCTIANAATAEQRWDGTAWLACQVLTCNPRTLQINNTTCQAAPTSLNATFATGCFRQPPGTPGGAATVGFKRYVYTFGPGGNAIIQQYRYIDSACRDAEYDIRWTRPYVIQGYNISSTTSNPAHGALRIQFNDFGVTRRAPGNDEAADLNTRRVCNGTTWIAGTRIDVRTHQCSSGEPVTFRTLFKIEPSRVRLGSYTNTSTPTTYPTSVYTEPAYEMYPANRCDVRGNASTRVLGEGVISTTQAGATCQPLSCRPGYYISPAATTCFPGQCTVAQYLAERPDVRTALGTSAAAIRNHYNSAGRAEGMCNPSLN